MKVDSKNTNDEKKLFFAFTSIEWYKGRYYCLHNKTYWRFIFKLKTFPPSIPNKRIHHD
ncbi:hypothetical protein QF004_000658 [Chryseobacterium sp. MDT2-18]|nr:hypothetical protein [Chryseobacterium sp. MDT2-18]